MQPTASTSTASDHLTQSPEPDDDGGPLNARKRKRATLACERCRKRKGRCDAAKPTCSNCAQARVACVQTEPENDGRKKKSLHRASQPPGLLEGGGSGSGDDGDGQARESASPGIATGRSPFDFSGTIFERPADLFRIDHDDTSLPAGSVKPRPGAAMASGVAPQDHDLDLLGLFAGFSQGVSAGNPQSSRQVTFEEPPAARAPFLLQYQRPFGPTAIQPGLEQISIAMRAPPPFSRAQSPARDSPESLPSADLSSLNFSFGQYPTTHTSFPFDQPFANSPSTVDRIFDVDSDIPRPEILDQLYPVFFSKMGCHFPFLSLASLKALDSDDPSTRVNAPLLINAVCAIAARFSDSFFGSSKPLERLPATSGVPFADKAKQILIPLLGYPSPNTVAALLLLAYYEFGLNSEGSLWMYTGMCLRMAQDLGIHQDINSHRPDVSPQQRASDNLLWWSCVVLDRALALGTGRPVTIKEPEITAPLPTAHEVALIASPSYAASELAPPPPSPFPYIVHFMLLYGRICEIVNLPPAAWRPSPSDSSRPPSRADTDDPGASRPAETSSPTSEASVTLCEIEDLITVSYNALPPDMVFTSANFKRHAAAGAGSTFLHVHLWFNCILILLYRPPLIYPGSNSSRLSLSDRLAVVNNSCLTIGQLLSCAEIIDEFSYLASPFINQCFFVAASAWIQDYRIRTGRNILATTPGEKHADRSIPSRPPPTNSSATILAQVALQNFKLCKDALDKQARYWLGVGWIAALVDKHGMKKSRISLKNATEGVDTFISGPEMAIFRRLVKRFSGNESVPSPELNDEAMNTLFSVLSQENFGQAPNLDLTPDDFALAYTFASVFPETASGGTGGTESLFHT